VQKYSQGEVMNNIALHQSAHKIAALIICTTPLWVTSAWAGNLKIEKMITFGDSLSDVKNLSSLTGGYPQAPYYDPGRFSNGLVWNEYLQNRMGLKIPTLSYYQYITSSPTSKSQPIDISNVGWNFAVGGSKTDGHLSGQIDPRVGLLGQIDSYKGLMAASGATVDSDTLYTVWSGNNDYLGLTPEELKDPALALQKIQKTVSNVLNSVRSLAEMGAANITIANLSNLGDTPLAGRLGEGVVNGLNGVTAIHNALLAKGIKSLKSEYSETNFIELDINSLVADILENPEDHGLISEAKTKSCTNIDDVPNLPMNFEKCENPDDYVYWDNQHPVTKIHKLAANYAFKEVRNAISKPSPGVIPEPSTVGTLGLLGFGLLWQIKQKQHK
jgi:phospholipase/lecithinase/hemolysin